MYLDVARSAGALSALTKLGLDQKLAAVPPAVLQAAEQVGPRVSRAAGVPKAWSLMGGAGAQLPPNVLQEIQNGGLSQQTRNMFDQQATGFLGAVQKGQNKMQMPSLAEHLAAQKGVGAGTSTEIPTNVTAIAKRPL
jgi:hypothetical protein